MARTHLLTALVCCLTIAGCGGDDKPPPIVPPLDSDRDLVADTVDCAPQDAQAWQTLNYLSRDEDADGFRVNFTGQVCAGSALPPRLSAAAVSGSDVDCNDSDVTRWATLQYAAVDSDRDGFGVAGAGSLCGGAALPAGMLATLPAAQDIDCDDADAAKWRLMTWASRDNDGDGHRVNSSGTLCNQGSLPAYLFAATEETPNLDCDDADAARWRWMGVYRDADGDGVGSGAATRACIGTVPAQGYVLTGYDPLDDPNDPLSGTVFTASLDSDLLIAVEDADDDDLP